MAALVALVVLSSGPALAFPQTGYTIENGQLRTRIELESDAFKASPFEVRNNAILLQAQIDGHPVTAMVDNGADISVIDEATARALGIRLSEWTEQVITPTSSEGIVRRAHDVTLAVPGQFSINTETMATDLSALSALVGKKVDLVLGAEIVSNLTVVLDTGTGHIYFKGPGGIDLPDGVSVPLTDNAILDADLNDHPLRLSIDLGRLGGPLLTEDAWSRAGLSQLPTVDTEIVDAFGRRNRVKTTRGVELTFSHRSVISDVSVSSLPTSCSCDGVIGYETLKAEGILLDLSNKKLTLFGD
ncbi:retropepsin-like aspartic protease [Brevundimonas intermedia]|uniref:retropepsin-like aspartic protease n=1 Tax=Brevundimonas intermedia TaxID=74315 RepID=UPI0035A5909E